MLYRLIKMIGGHLTYKTCNVILKWQQRWCLTYCWVMLHRRLHADNSLYCHKNTELNMGSNWAKDKGFRSSVKLMSERRIDCPRNPFDFQKVHVCIAWRSQPSLPANSYKKFCFHTLSVLDINMFRKYWKTQHFPCFWYFPCQDVTARHIRPC